MFKTEYMTPDRMFIAVLVDMIIRATYVDPLSSLEQFLKDVLKLARPSVIFEPWSRLFTTRDQREKVLNIVLRCLQQVP